MENIDTNIIFGFLLLNLAVGLYYGRKVKNLKDYALGGRNFNTATLTATIVATWIGGGFLTYTVSEVYRDGLWFIVAGAGDTFALLLTGCVIGPRVKGFFGDLSIAETMGTLFGKKVRLITAIACIAKSIGSVAIQIKVFSVIFDYFLGMETQHSTILSSCIVITYSTFGGIKAVTFTDAIQFITFGVFIPMFAIFCFKALGDMQLITQTINSTPSFDYRQLFDYQNSNFWTYLFLFFYFAIPGLNPTIFQRMLMAKDATQIRRSFSIAALITVVMHLLSCFIGFVIFSYNNTLSPNNVFMNVIDNYFSAEIKALAIISIIAMVMSTADSWVNTGSVIFTNDFCKSLNIKIKNQVVVARLFAIAAGVVAIFFALHTSNLFGLVLLTANFYMPIITVPLLLSVFGFRSTSRVALISISVAITVILFWRWQIQPSTGIDSVIPGMIANLITFLSAHYILGEAGGWVGNKDNVELIELKRQKELKKKQFKETLVNLPDNIMNFRLLEYCNSRLPKYEITYIFFAFAVLLTIIPTISIEQMLYQQHSQLINILQATALLISTAFICNGLWPKSISTKYLGIMWYLSVFTTLTVIGSFLVLLSKFSHVSLTILTIHLTMVPLLFGWRTALVMITFGLWISFTFYQKYIGEMVPGEIYDLKLKLMYMLFIIFGFVITIIKNKQEYVEETEAKVGTLEVELSHLDNEVSNLTEQVTDYSQQVEHYSERVSDQQKEIDRLGFTAQKILNNVNHELRLPVGNVMNFAEMISEGLESYSKEEIKELSDEVYKNSTRLSSMILNMLDLATLEVKKVDLQKKMVNFSELVEDRIKTCRKIYLQGKPINFKLSIVQDILINIDPNYIRQTVDNLVINAINFSKKGVIAITVRKQTHIVIFTITDQGIGIPEKDKYDVFTPFRMCSNTESKAEGRGVGLALCKSAINAHEGEINVDIRNGTTFRFALPID